MIKGFRDKATEELFLQRFSRRLSQDMQPVALRKLWMLDAAVEINDLRIPPSNHLELLRGNRKGQHSIRINKQWRICFYWREGNAYDVEITDYH